MISTSTRSRNVIDKSTISSTLSLYMRCVWSENQVTAPIPSFRPDWNFVGSITLPILFEEENFFIGPKQAVSCLRWRHQHQVQRKSKFLRSDKFQEFKKQRNSLLSGYLKCHPKEWNFLQFGSSSIPKPIQLCREINPFSPAPTEPTLRVHSFRAAD